MPLSVHEKVEMTEDGWRDEEDEKQTNAVRDGLFLRAKTRLGKYMKIGL